MEKQQDPATERLYAPSSDDGSDYEGQRPTSQRWTSNGLSMRSKVAIGASYVILIVLCVFLGIENLRLQQQVRESQSLVFPSIAKDKAWFRHDRVFSTTVNDTVFAGEPSPELDRAWHDMLQNTTIRVSKEDLDFYNVTSLPLADGSGYASETFMTHELHCLKRIRQWVYRDHYHKDLKGFARNEMGRHVNHCIETLRQGIMCRGDLSLGTYTYLGKSRTDIMGVTARTWGKHRCIDFDAIMKWSSDRVIDILEPGLLEDPKTVDWKHFTVPGPPH